MEFNLVGCLIGVFILAFLAFLAVIVVYAAAVVAGEADDRIDREM